MTNYADFSSLLQLGVGVGIGLSLFRAPVDLRVVRLARIMEAEIVAMRGDVSSFAKRKRRDMMDLRLEFMSLRDGLNASLFPFMVAAVMAALLNLASLIAVTLMADRFASNYEIAFFLFISVGWFIIELAALEVLARYRLGTVIADLEAIRKRRAPPLQVVAASKD